MIWLILSLNYTHPDQPWCSCLLHVLQHSPTIGYHGPRAPQNSKNLKSATLHLNVIDNKLHSECTKGYLAGPYNSPPLPDLQCSGVGVIPKKDSSWHMIMHLLAPHLSTINDRIDKEPYSLPIHSTIYSTIDDATRMLPLRRNALFTSVKSAFRLVSVNRQD